MVEKWRGLTDPGKNVTIKIVDFNFTIECMFRPPWQKIPPYDHHRGLGRLCLKQKKWYPLGIRKLIKSFCRF